MTATERIDLEERACRRRLARLAAMVLLAAPERIADQPTGDFLLAYINDRKLVGGWCRRAGVDVWRLAGVLTLRERSALARQLADYSREDTVAEAAEILDALQRAAQRGIQLVDPWASAA